MDKIELENLIRVNAQNYYEGKDCVEDAIFDSYVELLRAIDPDNSLIRKTGWGYDVTTSKKTEHMFGRITGIDDKIRPWEIAKHNLTDSCVTPKLDGVSIISYYKNGVYVGSLTRGDGEFGVNITPKVYSKFDKRLNYPLTGYIRGELVIPKNVWKMKYESPENKSPRSFIAGKLTREEGFESVISDADIVHYTVYSQGVPLTPRQQLNILLDSNHKTVHFLYDLTAKDLEDASKCQNILQRLCPNYYCDGLVVKTYEGQFAIKWNGEGVESKVVDVEWTMSRLGKFTPVIIIEPVELSGAVIKRVSGFNYKFIKDNTIGKDGVIRVVRSGEVIPYVVGITQVAPIVNIPTACPECGSLLEVKGVDLVCANTNCLGRKSGNLMFFVSQFTKLDGIGEAVLTKVFTSFGLNTVYDFLKFTNSYSQFTFLRWCNTTRGIGSTTFKKLVSLFDTFKKELDLKKFISSLGLPGLAEKSLDKIFELYSWEEVLSAVTNDTVIPGVTYVAINSIVDNKQYIQKLIDVLTVKPKLFIKQPNVIINREYDLNICITGSLMCSRREFLEMCSQVGIKESTIAKADILVTNDTSSGSSKNVYAQEHNIKVMSEQEFRSEYLAQS